jgi:glutamine cyclotransferase
MIFGRILILNLGLLFAVFISCQSRPPSDTNKKNTIESAKTSKSEAVIRKSLKIVSPKKNEEFTIGDQVTILVKEIKPEKAPDSIVVTFGKKYLGSLDSESWNFVLNTSPFNTGHLRITLKAFSNGEVSSSNSISIILKSDITPEEWSYQIINIYPHDRQAYTQGLVYEDGYMYEGTGQRGKSSLRKIKPETGDLLASLNLPPDLFGEGVCIFKDEIIQLTWTSGIGFVYDKDSFKFLNRFRYNTQGWGLTTNGKDLLMSDGTEKIHLIEPKYFTEFSSIEVYDQNGPLRNLNELELIDGKLYANIYTTDKVAVIDPDTGKVLAYINFTGLLEKRDLRPDTDVLNGIAYDKDHDRLFVTGKNWPKLFEVKIVK